MAASESAYTAMLQGVSQQLARLRLPGQVSQQDNMLSDTTTGPRRRPGAEFKYAFDFAGEDDTSIKSWDTDINGEKVNILIGTKTGYWVVIRQGTYEHLGSGNHAYLITTDPANLRATTVGSEFYFLNTTQKPVAAPIDPGITPPGRRGFYFVKSGAFSKSFVVTITTNLGTVTLSHTTVDGQTAGDAAKATPEFVANAIRTSKTSAELAAIGVSSAITDAFVYFHGTVDVTSLSVVSGSGALYITCSNNSKVRIEADLPQLLPATADEYIVTVGEQRSFKYYRYVAATTEWLETGAYDSPRALLNMPVRLKKTTGWLIEVVEYEGRVSGDEDNNPLPEFLKRGLTGLGSYMNRMVLLSGSQVFMSSSTNPLRFMRSTVAAIVDNDPIAVGSSANSSAEYRYCVQFQKDLILFSDKYQALVPSNGQQITPRTATVVVTSSYAGDMGAEPVPVGRTLLYPAPKSRNYFGLMEMISSQYSEAQYVSNEATAHLPKYMSGSCRFGVSSTTGNMVIFGSYGDRRALTVYEYLWDGEQKAQQAWHTWRFNHNIASAYFSVGVLHLVFIRNGLLVGCTIDPKQVNMDLGELRAPFLDLYSKVQVTNRNGVLPSWLTRFDNSIELVLTHASGPMTGEELGVESWNRTTGAFTTVRGFDSGPVYVGVRFRSTLVPTPPTYMDQNGHKIDSVKYTILRYGINTRLSSEYKITLADEFSDEASPFAQATLFYSSTELTPGGMMYASESRAIVPARVDADSAVLTMYTSGTGELNIVGLDYVGRINKKLRRR